MFKYCEVNNEICNEITDFLIYFPAFSFKVQLCFFVISIVFIIIFFELNELNNKNIILKKEIQNIKNQLNI